MSEREQAPGCAVTAIWTSVPLRSARTSRRRRPRSTPARTSPWLVAKSPLCRAPASPTQRTRITNGPPTGPPWPLTTKASICTPAFGSTRATTSGASGWPIRASPAPLSGTPAPAALRAHHLSPKIRDPGPRQVSRHDGARIHGEARRHHRAAAVPAGSVRRGPGAALEMATRRRDVVPKPREIPDACAGARGEKSAAVPGAAHREPGAAAKPDERQASPQRGADVHPPPNATTTEVAAPPARGSSPRPGDVVRLAPNILSVTHWDRLLGGLRYATSPARGLGVAATPVFFHRRVGVSEVPRQATRGGRHHRARVRASHPCPPRFADRAPDSRPCPVPHRRAGRRRR